MSRIALTPNASGTGTLTIAAPNTDTDRTLTLPDATGTVNISGLANEVPAGSAGAPAIYPTGDTNTGVYFPAANQVGIAANGVQQVLVTTSGPILNGQLTISSTGGQLLAMSKPDYSTGFSAVELVSDGRLRFTILNAAFATGSFELSASLYTNGSVGTSGQVLTSGGSGAAPSWASVGTATAGLAYGDVGTYAFLIVRGGGFSANATYAGSSLIPGGAYGNTIVADNSVAAANGSAIATGAGALAGTWRAMGAVSYLVGSNFTRGTVFLRIS